MAKEVIHTDKLPEPGLPFSPAVRVGELVYVSGQVGLDPATGKLVEGGVAEQTDQILKNLTVLLEAAGKSLADVFKVSVFLTDMRDFAAMNAVYAKHLPKPYPVRTTVAVVALPLGAAVEIDLIAS